MRPERKKAPVRRAGVRKATPQGDAWGEAFRQALKDFGNKAQAARIAWGAVDSRPSVRKRGRKSA